jgi:hypothetical protein
MRSWKRKIVEMKSAVDVHDVEMQKMVVPQPGSAIRDGQRTLGRSDSTVGRFTDGQAMDATRRKRGMIS